MLAPARETESSKGSPQQRKRRRFGDRIGTVADIIHADNIIIHVYRDAGNRLVSVGEPDEGGSATETGIGNVDRLDRAVTERNCFAAVLHTRQVGTERICTPIEGKRRGSTEQQQKLRSSAVVL